MNRKAFISLDTVISIFLLSMIIIITQNTNNLLTRASSNLYKNRQEIEATDKLLGRISVENISNYNSVWTRYDYENQIFKIRKTDDNKDYIKIEIKLDKDNSDDEKIYEKIILK